VKDHNRGQQVDLHRISHLENAFGNRTAEIPIEELRNWFDSHNWKPGTYKRYRTVLSLIYRLGIENKKINSTPARLLKRQKVSDGRVRFLNQRAHDEELRLRKVIALKYPNKMSEFDIAHSTGMRRSDQYSRINWSCVDLARKDLLIPGSKSRKSRHIPLNTAAIAAFKELRRGTDGKDPIFAGRNHGETLRGPRHWFEGAVREAGLIDFT
jgi:integrase